MRTCGCGCGGVVSEKARFMVGHWVRTATPEQRLRMLAVTHSSESQTKKVKSRWGKTSKSQRFWSVVDMSGSCWFRVGSKKDIYDGSRHRTAWELLFGPIKSGAQILHKCDNKRCTRPSHLFIGTQVDNMRDMVRKNRHAKKHNIDQKGENNNAAKYTAAQIRVVKKMLMEGYRTKIIHEKTGVGGATIASIRNGESWSSVT